MAKDFDGVHMLPLDPHQPFHTDLFHADLTPDPFLLILYALCLLSSGLFSTCPQTLGDIL
jgi:hypothetical protein